MSPISATRPTAVSVSMPRRQRRRATTGAHGPWVDCSRIRASSRSRRRAAPRDAPDTHRRRPPAEAARSEPCSATAGDAEPMLTRPRPDQPVAQQQLADPMAGTHQIAAEILTSAHQVTQRLKLNSRHRNWAQLAGRVQPRELERIACVGLDPVTRLARDRTRCADHQLDTSRPGCPRQREPGRAHLIDRAHRPGKRLSHSIAATEDPGNCAFQTSPDPNCTAAAAVFRACTSSPAKQIPSDTSTLPFHRCGNQPAPYDARERRRSQLKRPA